MKTRSGGNPMKVRALALAVSVACGAVWAEEGRQYFDIKTERVGEALKAFAVQSDSEILFAAAVVGDKKTSGLTGEYTEEEALEKILEGTGLKANKTKDNVFLVQANANKEDIKKKSVKNQNTNEVTPSDTQVQTKQQASRLIEEIMVTANKRIQNLQNVPFSISALSSDTIEKRGLVGMEDYLRALPGVSMQDRGASQNNVIIRGIASDPQLEDSTVGIYFGETPVTGLGSSSAGDLSGSADIKLVDIERIEVLRGPQGTLYGSGSMGGTVRVIPASPNLEEVEGKLATRYSRTSEQGGDNSMVQGVLNVPLIEDRLAVRAVAYKFDNSGYIDNVAASHPTAEPNIATAIDASGIARDRDEVGSDQYTGFRLTTLWQPTDQLSIALAYTQQEIEQEGFPEVNNNLAGDFQQVRLRTGIGGSDDEFMGNDIDITNLVVEYDLGWGSLSSSSSWTNYDATNINDLSFLYGGFGIGPVYAKNGAGSEAFVEELRFTSQFGGLLEFLAGIYYEDQESISDALWLWSGDVTVSDPAVPFLTVNTSTAVEQQALFGELTYKLTDKVVATVGVRYFDYDQDFSDFVLDQYANNRENGQSYKTNLTFTPTDDLLIYGQWAEGFRLGQARANPPSVCDANDDGILDDVGFADPGPLDSDTSESFELGIKTSLANNRVTLNAAVYRINWEGMPVTLPLPSCNGNVALNAGESKSEGIELEVQAYITEQLLLDISASYGEATLTEDAENLGVKGDNLPGSADYNISVGLEYGFTVVGFDAFARGDYAYIDEYYHNIAEIGEASGGFGLINLKAGINFNAVDVDLFVNNLTNSDDFTWVESFLRDFGPNRAYRLRPRTMGLNVNYRF